MPEIPKPVISSFSPRKVTFDRTHVPTMQDLSASDRDLLHVALADPGSVANIFDSADGRNVYYPLGTPIGPFTHIQLSGGYYTPILKTEFSSDDPLAAPVVVEPTQTHYHMTRPGSYAVMGMRSGRLVHTPPLHEPTGGYTQTSAMTKYENTLHVHKAFAASQLLVPRPISLYSTQKPGEAQIYGLATLSIDPRERFNSRIRKMVSDAISPRDFHTFNNETYATFFKALPDVHRQMMTHGQPHAGNFGIHEATGQTYLADWSTLTKYGNNKTDGGYTMGKFLDIHRLFDTYQRFLERNTIGNRVAQAYEAIRFSLAHYTGNIPREATVIQVMNAYIDQQARTFVLSEQYLKAGARAIDSTHGTIVDMNPRVGRTGKGRRTR